MQARATSLWFYLFFSLNFQLTLYLVIVHLKGEEKMLYFLLHVKFWARFFSICKFNFIGWIILYYELQVAACFFDLGNQSWFKKKFPSRKKVFHLRACWWQKLDDTVVYWACSIKKHKCFLIFHNTMNTKTESYCVSFGEIP